MVKVSSFGEEVEGMSQKDRECLLNDCPLQVAELRLALEKARSTVFKGSGDSASLSEKQKALEACIKVKKLWELSQSLFGED